MTELVKVENNQVVASSRVVAENFGKQHGHVIRDIGNLEISLSNFGELFYKTTYTNSRGKEYPMYLMNKKGFMLLVMGFNGSKAIETKMKFLDKFEQMEEELRALKMQLNVPKTNLQMMQAVINEQVRQEQLLMEQKQELEEVGNRLDSVEGVQSVLSVGFGNDWRNTANKVITRIGKETGDYRKGWNEVYEMLDARGFRVATRAKNATEREGRKVSKLDIIERDKKLKTAFIESVRAVAINNHVDTSDLI